MQHWRVPFLGLQAIPPELTDFEIRYFFTFTAKERAAIFSRYGDQHRLAVALQIGMLKMTGRTLDAFETVPPAVLRHLQTTLQLATPELTSLRALYRRRSTLHDHQAWATPLLAFRPLTERRQRALLRQVRHEALKAFTLNHLVEFAKRWLYERRMLIPADCRVRDLARTAYAETEHALLDAVRREMPAAVLQTGQDALFAPRQGQASALEWLQQAPRRKCKGLKEQLDKIHFLKALHVDASPLAALRLERQRAYARRMHRRRPARFRALKDPGRTLEMVCFLHITLLQTTDVAVSLADLLVVRNGASCAGITFSSSCSTIRFPRPRSCTARPQRSEHCFRGAGCLNRARPDL